LVVISFHFNFLQTFCKIYESRSADRYIYQEGRWNCWSWQKCIWIRRHLCWPWEL